MPSAEPPLHIDHPGTDYGEVAFDPATESATIVLSDKPRQARGP